MTRSRQFEHAQTIKLKQLERALVAYYAQVHRLDGSKVIRSMIRNYVLADSTFDTKAFQKFVKEHMVPRLEDEDMAEEMRGQIKTFLAGAKTEKGTLT